MYVQYSMNQTCLPMEINAFLPNNHIVYDIDRVVEDLQDIDYAFLSQELLKEPSYHPKVLLKALLFAYSESIFSGRKTEKMMQENLAMQWLTGQTLISYRTINRFRVSVEMKCIIKDLYCSFAARLKSEQLISQKSIFIDGTKIEADANKYTFVWKKATDRYYQQLKDKEVLYYEEEIAPVIEREMTRDKEEAFTKEEMTELRDIVQEELNEVEQALENEVQKEKISQLKKKRRTLKKYNRKLTKDFLPREDKYAMHYETFKGRNSFSKTDTDATFMRMKDDHMMNGQLKPGYNIQIATENQFVLHAKLFPNPTDTLTLIPFIESIPSSLLPSTYVVADTGYGSQENLEYMDKSPWNPLIKYGMYEKEQKKKYRESDKNLANWEYDETEDAFIHPDGTYYHFGYVRTYTTSSGYKKFSHVYRSSDPLYRNERKTMSVSYDYEGYKAEMREMLSSAEGKDIYAQRKIDVEPTFGQVKANLRLTRFSVRGQSKVENETDLIFMANNLRKYHKRTNDVKKYE